MTFVFIFILLHFLWAFPACLFARAARVSVFTGLSRPQLLALENPVNLQTNKMLILGHSLQLESHPGDPSLSESLHPQPRSVGGIRAELLPACEGFSCG